MNASPLPSPTPSPRRLPLLAVAVAVLVLCSWPQAASAHAELASSNPADGAKLETLPSTVRLELNEEVKAPAFVVVTSPDGTRVNSETVDVAGRVVTSEVTAPSEAGEYTMAYRIVSADAHVVTDTIAFEVAPPTQAEDQAAPTPAPTPETTSATPGTADSGGSEASSAFTILGFAVVAALLLGFVLRAGLKSPENEED